MTVPDFSRVKLLLLDVDGVLTDGRIIYSDDGAQIKAFDSKDGLGLRLLMDYGIRVGIITGRQSGALRARCRDLGIDLVYDGVRDKAPVLGMIARRSGIDPAFMAFAGDDLPDLPVMKRVGIGISVADAVEAVRAGADYVTVRNGGQGAVREICELILKAGGHWDAITAGFLQ